MRRFLHNHKKVCYHSPFQLRRCLQDTPSSMTLNHVFTLSDKTTSAENNKLNVVNVHVCEECHPFTNVKCEYESPESKENRNIKNKQILLENKMDNAQNISSRKTRQKPVNGSDVIYDAVENCENEFPSSRKSRKKCKSKIVKGKTQKIKMLQKCENEKNRSRETVKQASDKQNLVHNDTKKKFINGKETHIIKNNFQEALKALENTPIRKSTRLQRKQNNEESKTNYRKVLNSIENRYKKHENIEGVQSVVSESRCNERKCKPSSEIPMKENCSKFKCNIMSPIRENISESYNGLTCIPRDQRIHVPLYKTETVRNNIPEDRLAVYDFEYDENEEPCIKKQRKKRIYNKKPKLCSQNLTINKIKFGSTSSLNSTKSKFGSSSSINSIHSEYNYLHNGKNTEIQNKKKPADSEYQSKKVIDMCTSSKRTSQVFESTPTHNFSLNGTSDCKKLFGICSPLHNHTSVDVKSTQKHNLNTPSYNVNNIDFTNICCAKNESHSTTSVHSSGKLDCSNLTDCWSKNNMSYGSKQQVHSSNVHDISSVSTEGTNFTTPCTQKYDVAYNNSIFDEHDSFNSVVWSDKKCSENKFASEEYDEINFFGFDTDESIEVPLLSSIKKKVAPSKKDLFPDASYKREIFPLNNMSIQDTIQILQSEVNHKQKTYQEKMPENSESCETDIPLSSVEDGDKPVYFRKPPRRSYECIRNFWEHEDIDEAERTVEEEVEESLETEAKKHHRKKTKSHAEPPRRSYERVRNFWEHEDIDEAERTVEEEVEESLETEAKKHHRKKTKSHAEEEAEKLVAKLNCQFQEIDKFNLCVE